MAVKTRRRRETEYRRRRRRPVVNARPKASRQGKLLPAGIRMIAYWHFFWSSLCVAILLLAAVGFAAGITLANVPMKELLTIMFGEPFKSGNWTSSAAIHSYEADGAFLAIMIGGPFIGFRLLARRRLAYFLCMLEVSVLVALVSYGWLRFNEQVSELRKLIADEVFMGRLQMYVGSATVLAIVMAAGVFVYMLTPKIQKIYF